MVYIIDFKGQRMSSPSQSPREAAFTERPATQHDLQFLTRKVNRYEVQLAQQEEQLAQAHFRLSKMDDLQLRYDTVFSEHQDSLAALDELRAECDRRVREQEMLTAQTNQLKSEIQLLRVAQEANDRTLNQSKLNTDALKDHSSNAIHSQKEALKLAFAKDIDNIKEDHKHIMEKTNRETNQLKNTIANYQLIEFTLQHHLNCLKKEKQTQTTRLNERIFALENQLSIERALHHQHITQKTQTLFRETLDEKEANWRVSEEIQNTLMQELRNLAKTLEAKNNEIGFLIELDKSSMQSNEEQETALKEQIKRLQDKIFIIQRENELQIYRTLERLQKAYRKNLAEAQKAFDSVRQTHILEVKSLRAQIDALNNEVVLLGKEHVALQHHHKQLAQEKEHAIHNLSQNLIQTSSAKDLDLKNYTTSMKQIEMEAKSKLDDLHTTILNKEGEVQVLTSQLALKNTQITHLLSELSSLRGLNREKLHSLSNAGAKEQQKLLNEIVVLKRNIHDHKQSISELESKLEDQIAQHELEMNRSAQELLLSKEQNEMLKGRNELLTEWCRDMERELKLERTKNVEILHDNTSAKIDNVQAREQARVEVEAIRDKEMEQLRNIHRLEKGRLEAELTKCEHDLRDKKDELSRLMVQFKHLESKIGKSTKLDKSAEEEGKCKATLMAEIKLTENIFNAINTR